MTFIVTPHLERNAAAWKSNSGPSINDPASDYFGAMQSANGMVVTNGYGGTKQYAGALVSLNQPVPRNPYNTASMLQYIALRVRFEWKANVYHNIARHELDLKVCFKTRPDANTKIRNVANFSTQWNRDTGQFQIDKDPPGWVNTGFVVQDIEPDVTHLIDYMFWYDPNAQIFSVLSINFDGTLYEIPDNLRNVAASNTNWEEVAKSQIQNEMYNTGSTLIEYSEFSLAWSDETFTNGWPITATDNE